MYGFYTNAAGLSPATDPVSMVFVVFLAAVSFLVLIIVLWFFRKKGRQPPAREYIYSGKNRL